MEVIIQFTEVSFQWILFASEIVRLDEVEGILNLFLPQVDGVYSISPELSVYY